MRRGGSWNVVLLAGVFLFVAVLCCSAYAQPGEEKPLFKVSPAAVEMMLKNAKALRDEAAALAKAGKEHEAAALLKRAEQMEGRAKEFVAGMLKRAEELREKAAGFATAGREREAAALRQEADALEGGAREVAECYRVQRLPILTKEPYVQDLTPAAATIKWETTAQPDSSVLYRKAGDADWTSVANAPARILHEARLEGLAPGTEYQYRVQFRTTRSGGVDSDEVTFRTPPERPESVRFAVYGDTRSSPEGHARVVAAMLERRRGQIAFVIHTGDLVADGNRYSRWGPEFFGPIRELAASIPVYPVLGNHEMNSENYFDLFALPGNERFYSRRFGPAHIWFLDSSWPLTPDSEQHEWFASGIAASDAAWKFVVFHHPVFSSGPHGSCHHLPCAAPRRHLQEYYVPLFEEHGVAMVFSGHDHLYERSEKGGIHYVTAGGGGAPLYEAEQDNSRNPYSEVLVIEHHYCVVEADADSVKMSVFALDGTVLDEVELSAEKAP